MSTECLRYLRLVHAKRGCPFAWDGRLVYGVCHFDRPRSVAAIHRATGIHRPRVTSLVNKLQAANLLDGLRAKPSALFPKCRSSGEPACLPVGVMTGECPLRPLANVLYWQWWNFSPEERAKSRTARYAALLGVGWQCARDAELEIKKHGGFRPPEACPHWWVQDKPLGQY
jgi:hypothetical protein